jgi:hypothetical protein
MTDSQEQNSGSSRCPRLAQLIAAFLVALALALAPAAAARPPLVWQSPEEAAIGSGAGQFGTFMNFSGSPSGNLYATDPSNRRISVLNPYGEFVRSWGWGVLDGSPELQACTAQTGCQAGTGGFGAGQFAKLRGIAVDDGGSAYVVDKTEEENFGAASVRVQKFDANGNFELMFGGEVNKTTGEDVCTAADLEAGEVCGAGVPGSGPGELEASTHGLSDRIAVGSEGHVFVGEVDRIQEFDSDGSHLGEVPVPEEVQSLAVDSNGFFYLTFVFDAFNSENDIHKFTPGGSSTGLVFPVTNPRAVEVDSNGDVWAVENPGGKFERVRKFGSQGQALIPDAEEEDEREKALIENEPYEFFAEAPNVPFLSKLTALAFSEACGMEGGTLYTAFGTFEGAAVRAYGEYPDPVLCPPLVKRPPTIVDQFAVNVGERFATVRARIHPHFLPDTTYQVEYGTGKCSEGGCPQTAPASEYELGVEGLGAPVFTKAILLQGLLPQSTYHFRFVAESGGGGPVHGSGEAEAEGTFITAAGSPPAEADTCANSAFRTGPGAALPDCRAYEMVSPLDKENGDIFTMFNSIGNPAAHYQAATSGDRFTYSSYRAFANSESAPYTSQYLAERSTGGWQSTSISSPREVSISGTLDTDYKAFSPDLCNGWLTQNTLPVLAAGAVQGFENIYRRGLDLAGCSASPGYEALTTVAPPSKPTPYEPELQGVAADGSVVAFRANDKLTANAAAGKGIQCYESRGQIRLVSVLPNGSANPGDCSIGTSTGGLRQALTHNAVAADGSRIYWTAAASSSGPLYLRLPAKNQTLLVSAAAARFLGAAADGAKALYLTTGEDLYQYDAATKTSSLIAHKAKGILGASEDLARVYLISEEALDGAGAGVPNLYLYEAEAATFTFVGALSAADARLTTVGKVPTPVNVEPAYHNSRVSADGMHAVFTSNGQPSGIANQDAISGEPDAEVYLYDAAAGALHCLSCKPSGARPSGRKVPTGGLEAYWVAAQIPPGEHQLYSPRVLAEDGSRAFFESFEPLVARDTNSQQDVYEWEKPGAGSCTAVSPAYREANGGCIYLISAGDDPAGSHLIDVDPSGSDVFFTTGSSLVVQDPGLIDLYDARIQGGFPPPPSPPEACQGEACQSPAAAPDDPTPASSTYSGSGNPSKAKARQCPRGKVRRSGKARCVKAKKKAGKNKKGARR